MLLRTFWAVVWLVEVLEVVVFGALLDDLLSERTTRMRCDTARDLTTAGLQATY